MMLTGRRARMEGFIILDYTARYGEAVEALSKLIAQGKLKTVVACSTVLTTSRARSAACSRGRTLASNCSRLTAAEDRAAPGKTLRARHRKDVMPGPQRPAFSEALEER